MFLLVQGPRLLVRVCGLGVWRSEDPSRRFIFGRKERYSFVSLCPSRGCRRTMYVQTVHELLRSGASWLSAWSQIVSLWQPSPPRRSRSLFPCVTGSNLCSHGVREPVKTRNRQRTGREVPTCYSGTETLDNDSSFGSRGSQRGSTLV